MPPINIRRGFHRLGLAGLVPLAIAAAASLCAACGLAIAPDKVGPLFGIRGAVYEVTAPDGARFRYPAILEDEKAGRLSSNQEALLAAARSARALPPRDDGGISGAALASLAIGVALLAAGAAWYGLMRTLAWLIAGFIG